jgi:hypothetical protein
MRITMAEVAFVIACVAVGACGTPPKVVQGIVVSNDPVKKSMVVRDDLNSGSNLEFSLEEAEIGAEAVAGDTVRIAYREHDGKRTATRVMNITRQREAAGKSAGH